MFFESAIVGKLNKRIYVHLENWQNLPLRGGDFLYVIQILSALQASGVYICRNPSKNS